MIRKRLIDSPAGGEANFRWRGHEVTRLEGFSDAVFAFAVTLLVVSLEVPKTFPELLQAMHGFFAFGICFTLLALVWYQHYRFFRRYGLENPWTVTLNCALLFFVLFYVYPLKFLFSAVIDQQQFEIGEIRALAAIYALGWGTVFGVFALLYLHAWRKREQLELDAFERLRTRQSLFDQIAMVCIALLAALLAWVLPPQWVGNSAVIYVGVGIYYTIAGSYWGRRQRALGL